MHSTKYNKILFGRENRAVWSSSRRAKAALQEQYVALYFHQIHLMLK